MKLSFEKEWRSGKSASYEKKIEITNPYLKWLIIIVMIVVAVGVGYVMYQLNS